MANFDRFDVVLVLFPFTERQGQRQRPAIVLTNRGFNEEHGHIVAAMVTTASTTRWPSDLPLVELGPAGLTRPSVMRMKLFTVDGTLVRGKVGQLAAEDRSAVAAGVEALLLN